MKSNAMPWGKAGAQKMLHISSIKKNQQWEQYPNCCLRTHRRFEKLTD